LPDSAAIYSVALCIAAGLACGGLGSVIYERWAPHDGVRALKQARRANRIALRDPELTFGQALRLACSDLRDAVRHCRLVLPPSLLSAVPTIVILLILEAMIGEGINPHDKWLFLGSAAISGLFARLVIAQTARARRP
jgi:hypothetical protein